MRGAITYVEVPKVGEKRCCVPNKCVDLSFLQAQFLLEQLPVAMAGRIYFNNEIEDIIGFGRYLLQDGARALPGGTRNKSLSETMSSMERG